MSIRRRRIASLNAARKVARIRCLVAADTRRPFTMARSFASPLSRAAWRWC